MLHSADDTHIMRIKHAEAMYFDMRRLPFPLQRCVPIHCWCAEQAETLEFWNKFHLGDLLHVCGEVGMICGGNVLCSAGEAV